jgi:hypothetical protein
MNLAADPRRGIRSEADGRLVEIMLERGALSATLARFVEAITDKQAAIQIRG